MMEARLEGRGPFAVTHHAETVNSAVHGAAEALTKVLDSALGRHTRPRESVD
jgi:hypothetical protein